jgi:hypothetical protein
VQEFLAGIERIVLCFRHEKFSLIYSGYRFGSPNVRIGFDPRPDRDASDGELTAASLQFRGWRVCEYRGSTVIALILASCAKSNTMIE